MSTQYDFSDAQKMVILSICDAAFQSHNGKELDEILACVPAFADDKQRQLAKQLALTKFSDLPGGVDALTNQFKLTFSPTNMNNVGMALSLLSTRAGTLVLTGHASAFPDLTLEQRETVLKAWSTSRLLTLRQLFRGVVAVAMYVTYTNFHDLVNATGFPAEGDPKRFTDASRAKKHHEFAFEKITAPYQYFDTDVLVVGSGAGGGVVTSQLAEKGWKVLTVEKGSYYKPEEITGTAKDGFELLYEGKGLMATEDGGLNILAGSTFGGGTVVNWSASLRPQHWLREQWAKLYDLPYFLSADFSKSVEYACNRMGVSDKYLKHNIPNQKMIDASIQLGYPVSNIPQNTAGTEHSCGFCGFGCIYSEKQSGPVCWLKHAAQDGARFMVKTSVERLLFAPSHDSPAPTEKTLDQFWPTSSRRVCVGALVKSEDGQYAIVRAKRGVVVSSGSINSPAVLLRSGLKNPRIGKNLKLHPTTFITGYYDERIDPWDGAIMTAVSSVQENWDGTHHGVKMEVIQSFPGGRAAAFIPWRGSKDHKKIQVQFGNSFTIIAIARDRGSGSIILDKNGVARVDYTLDTYDGQSLLRGIVAGAEMHLVAGAKRISSPQYPVEDYYPEPGHKFLADPKWKEWIAKVEKAGVYAGYTNVGSAHQMGSNQMGTKPSSSVVDPRGRVWGTDSLYVCDASIFPTASGVNPMITNMSVSHSVSQFIDQDLREKLAKPSQAQAHL
ncbi:hypothetical protein ACM66B_005783 [Microbotryomycetes sp. NB124-2]